MYLLECKKCKNSSIGNAQTKFHLRLKNCKSTEILSKVRNKEYRNYKTIMKEGKENWQYAMIDQCSTNAELRKREVFRQHCYKTFF